MRVAHDTTYTAKQYSQHYKSTRNIHLLGKTLASSHMVKNKRNRVDK